MNPSSATLLVAAGVPVSAVLDVLFESLLESKFTLPRSQFSVILWAEHPRHGVHSIPVADIPPEDSSTHPDWFARMGWPSAGSDYDRIPRGEATVDSKNKMIHMRMSSSHEFASPAVVDHLRRAHRLQKYQFVDQQSWASHA